MKKENIYKFLYTISMLLILAFGIRLGVDYFKYDKINNSAPFYAYIIIRAIEFLIPSAIGFIFAKLIKIKTMSKGAEPNCKYDLHN